MLTYKNIDAALNSCDTYAWKCDSLVGAVLKRIEREKNNSLSDVLMAFSREFYHLGYFRGIQAERSRRKEKQALPHEKHILAETVGK